MPQVWQRVETVAMDHPKRTLISHWAVVCQLLLKMWRMKRVFYPQPSYHSSDIGFDSERMVRMVNNLPFHLAAIVVVLPAKFAWSRHGIWRGWELGTCQATHQNLYSRKVVIKQDPVRERDGPFFDTTRARNDRIGQLSLVGSNLCQAKTKQYSKH